MDVDVIILSNTKSNKFYRLTKKCISTLLRSEKKHHFNIILVETNRRYKKIGKYSKCSKVITPNISFNYNRFLNIGLRHCASDFVVISNNDVEFNRGWFSVMMNVMEKYNLDSASPSCPIWNKREKIKYAPKEEVRIGYEICKELFGHCLVINKKVLDAIGKWDESFFFWHQDHDYAEQLKLRGFKHGLVVKSIVKHFAHSSHSLIRNSKMEMMTSGMEKIFKTKYEKHQIPIHNF